MVDFYFYNFNAYFNAYFFYYFYLIIFKFKKIKKLEIKKSSSENPASELYRTLGDIAQ